MKLVSLLKLEMSRNESSKVVTSYCSHRVSVDGTLLAKHRAKKSNNPQNNSGLCEYNVISVRQTSAVRIDIMISTTDNYYHSQAPQNALLIFDYC